MVPKNGGAASTAWFVGGCVGTGTYDGTALYVVPGTSVNSGVYIASWNTSQRQIEVFHNLVQMADPFPTRFINGHAIFPKSQPTPDFDSYATVIAPDDTGTFWVARFDGVGTMPPNWTVSKVASAGFQWSQYVPVRGGTALRQEGYSADSWTPKCSGLFVVLLCNPGGFGRHTPPGGPVPIHRAGSRLHDTTELDHPCWLQFLRARSRGSQFVGKLPPMGILLVGYPRQRSAAAHDGASQSDRWVAH